MDMTDHTPDYAVAVTDLCKTYAASRRRPPKPALRNVSLAIPRGSFFGLLGPNGAGKSTLINILAGLVVKTSGRVSIWGHDLDGEMRAARRSIGIVPQELNLDPFFTPRELLELQAGLYGVKPAYRRTSEILEAVGLAPQAESYARTLSGGMRRRLLVAKAMVHSPPVLVLDEPTAGVDVELRRQLWDYVRELNAQGTTVLLTTHYLEEAEELCDRIAIINHGRLIACEDKKDLLKRLDAKEMVVTVESDPWGDEMPAALKPFAPTRDANRLTFRYPPSRVHSGDILEAIRAADLRVIDVATRETELEDIFVSLTSQPDEEPG